LKTGVSSATLALVYLHVSLLCTTVDCAHRRERVPAHAVHEDCFSEARAGVGDGWWCVDDGQIAGARFAAHVVYQNAEGSLSPLTDVQLWRKALPSPSNSPDLKRMPITVASDGYFSYRQLVHYSRAVKKIDGRFVTTESREEFIFTLRAHGCEDYSVPFRTDDPAHLIVMSCESRNALSSRQSK